MMSLLQEIPVWVVLKITGADADADSVDVEVAGTFADEGAAQDFILKEVPFSDATFELYESSVEVESAGFVEHRHCVNCGKMMSYFVNKQLCIKCDKEVEEFDF